MLIIRQIKQRQTVIDFTCQHSGTMEALFEVAQLNGIGITEAVAPGTLLKAEQRDLKVIAVFTNSELDIITDEQEHVIPGGIGFMQVGTSFKVS